MEPRYVFANAVLAVLLAAGLVSPAQAETATYSDRTTWQNAVDALTPIVTEDFNSQPLGSLTDNTSNTVGLITVFPNNAPGSAIHDGTQARQIDGTQFLHTLVDGSPVRSMDVLFGADVGSFGFDFTELVPGGDQLEVTLGNGDNFRLSSIVGGAHAGFVGFISDTAFDSITFHDPFISFSDVGIDNFSFAPPPPSATATVTTTWTSMTTPTSKPACSDLAPDSAPAASASTSTPTATTT